MSINLIAILLSFAMMLTGAGEAGQPAEAAKTLVLRNVSVSYNGQNVELAPSARLGVATDGEKAVFDFGLELNDETLLPVQLGVSEAGVAALVVNADEAVSVAAEAIEAALDQANVSLEGMMEDVEGEEAEQASLFMAEEFLPAYFGLLEAAQDEAFQERVQEKGEALFAEMIDRGEGEPVTEELEGETVELTRYTYTVDGPTLMALADALYADTPELADYYAAMMKLYNMMPEESGLNGVASFADLLEKTGLELTMDVVEELSEDGETDITDAVMTIDMNAMLAAQQAALEEAGKDAELPELPPLVMYINANEIGDSKTTAVSCAYELEGTGVDFNMSSAEMSGFVSMSMNMSVNAEGEEIASVDLSGSSVTDMISNDKNYSALFTLSAPGGMRYDFALNGASSVDGAAQNSLYMAGEDGTNSYGLSFDLDVVNDAIEDAVNGHEAFVIDDLSEEGLNALGENEKLMGVALKVAGAMTEDVGKLLDDESVQALMDLLNSGAEAADEAEYDYTYDIEDDEAQAYIDTVDGEDGDFSYEIEGIEFGDDVEGDDDYMYEDVEDDGVLPFDVPVFGWLPEGWEAADTDVDTAYDWVEVLLSDESGENSATAFFFLDDEASQSNYIVADDGSFAPVEGREVTVADYGEGNVSVTLHEDSLYVNMMFAASDIDLETIGQIVAGIQF